MNIGGWLRNLGLERYEPLFIENAIDSDVLAELTEGDLEKIGIPLGDRKRLIKAIRTMLADSPTTFTSGVGENAQSGQPHVAAAERRQLTVMFCDLVDSTALSARLDPEDLRDVIGAYRHRVADAVARFEGFIARYMGDGVLVYFGYPRSHEDNAERAVRAGLAAVAAVRSISTRVGIQLQ